MKRKLLQKILAEVGLSISVFDKAFNDAKKLYGSIQTEQSDRIKVSCALSYCKDGRLCDLGSYVNMYPVVLALLGILPYLLQDYGRPKCTLLHCPDFWGDVHRAELIYCIKG